MRVFASFMSMGCALLSSVGSAEPLVFHSQTHANNLTVRLSLVENVASTHTGYDYDVQIRIDETTGGGETYTDPSGHGASVRCAAPAAVALSGIEYPIASPTVKDGDWKEDLWKAVCTPSMS